MDEYDCLYPLTGLLFNIASGTCEWAAKAACFTEEGIEAVEVEFEPEFDCEEEGNFPDPEYCMRYFRCDDKLEVGSVLIFLSMVDWWWIITIVGNHDGMQYDSKFRSRP